MILAPTLRATLTILLSIIKLRVGIGRPLERIVISLCTNTLLALRNQKLHLSLLIVVVGRVLGEDLNELIEEVRLHPKTPVDVLALCGAAGKVGSQSADVVLSQLLVDGIVLGLAPIIGDEKSGMIVLVVDRACAAAVEVDEAGQHGSFVGIFLLEEYVACGEVGMLERVGCFAEGMNEAVSSEELLDLGADFLAVFLTLRTA